MDPEVSTTLPSIGWIALLWGALFAWSYHREPRRFRNALFFLAFAWSLLDEVLYALGRIDLIVILWGLAFVAPLVAAPFLVANGIKVMAREGVYLSTALPALLALVILAVVSLPFVVVLEGAPSWALYCSLVVWAEAFWAAFTLVALLVYSMFYQRLPRKTRYDYIVVHGAGLMADGTPTPLLAGRIDKAAQTWLSQGREPLFVASGGKGSDEACSEAEAISTYLQNVHGVPADHVLLEDRSTTTWENLELTKEMLDRRAGGAPYRCCLVTSDYHVFRTVEYAHKCGLSADGVGCTTASYYFPTAFLREYVAITRAHWWPYAVIGVLGLAATLFLWNYR